MCSFKVIQINVSFLFTRFSIPTSLPQIFEGFRIQIYSQNFSDFLKFIPWNNDFLWVAFFVNNYLFVNIYHHVYLLYWPVE